MSDLPIHVAKSPHLISTTSFLCYNCDNKNNTSMLIIISLCLLSFKFHTIQLNLDYGNLDYGNFFMVKTGLWKLFWTIGWKKCPFLTKTLNFIVLMLKHWSLNVFFCQNCEIHYITWDNCIKIVLFIILMIAILCFTLVLYWKKKNHSIKWKPGLWQKPGLWKLFAVTEAVSIIQVRLYSFCYPMFRK